ncbi:hypothetical protein E2C01_101763 [Portunus trituberculatus]|uniref:Uncharacterized protein n=1 Tax=Portunus trituberculatus TaxID=210409 RepID=A0A5B7KGV2_PORTR|nr:hypothetical protein [Portunus trituberculatus]
MTPLYVEELKPLCHTISSEAAPLITAIFFRHPWKFSVRPTIFSSVTFSSKTPGGELEKY